MRLARRVFNRCPERMHSIVDAARSLGLVLGRTCSARDWASLIDHTLLKPMQPKRHQAIVRRGREFSFASVCVPDRGAGLGLSLRAQLSFCTAIGVPLGATLADVQAYEARRAIFDGARDVDMVSTWSARARRLQPSSTPSRVVESRTV